MKKLAIAKPTAVQIMFQFNMSSPSQLLECKALTNFYLSLVAEKPTTSQTPKNHREELPHLRVHQSPL
jgi:hypothetical protein